MKYQLSFSMLASLAAVVAAVLIGLSGCTAPTVSSETVFSGGPAETVPVQRGEALPQAVNNFGLDLLKATSKADRTAPNVIVSPASVHAALSMTLNGATRETAVQMRRVLRTASMDPKEANTQWAALLAGFRSKSSEQELEVANGLFARKGITFKKPFLDSNRDYFGAELSTLDFVKDDVAGVINGWVAKNTRGMISKIVDKNFPDAILYLVNAVYFKGDWVEPFRHESTGKRPFTRADGARVDVNMMYTRGHRPYAQNSFLQATKLPYKGLDASFYVLLPRPGVSLDAARASLEGTGFSDLRAAMASPDTGEILLGLPKSDVEFATSLKEFLIDMGMPLAFDKMKADFSGMTELDVTVFIEEVLHKTKVKVDEKGTEAAASTVVVMAPSGAPPQVRAQIICDRPYLFAIVDEKSGTMLFLGAVGDPTALGSAAAATYQGQPLQLTIKSDKNVYAEGEPIDLIAELKNSGKAAVRIYSPEALGVSEIVVEDSRGVRVSPRGIKAERIDDFSEFMVIQPGKTGSAKYKNLRWYLCGSAQKFAGSAQLRPGTYTVHATVTNPPVYGCGEDPANPREPFEKTNLTGKLTSNRITLRIDSTSGAGKK